jgi:hypothetical protein
MGNQELQVGIRWFCKARIEQVMCFEIERLWENGSYQRTMTIDFKGFLKISLDP